MRILYSILMYLTAAVLWLLQFVSPKLKQFVRGRDGVYETLQKNRAPADRPIWFHCASLGEFEQGVPIMAAMRKKYPDRKIAVTFFSPSGYEIKKDTPLADVVTYLPLDTPANAAKFIEILRPGLAIFIKYEIWPNYLRELDRKKIPALLVSGLFRENQLFFQPYGSFMRRALHRFNHIFVQNEASENLLEKAGFTKVSISGDTRFDRVSQQIERANHLAFIEEFLKVDTQEKPLCIVCGSTWAADEAVLLPYINRAPAHVKFVIAPHKIDSARIAQLERQLGVSNTRYTERTGKNSSRSRVLIVDTIGLLTKIYSYADIAYVGGAMGSTGLHNILEPATFGVPVLIGKNFEEFPEARRLQQLAGLYSVTGAGELSEIMAKLVSQKDFREKTGMIAGHFVNQNTGATRITMEYIAQLTF